MFQLETCLIGTQKMSSFIPLFVIFILCIATVHSDYFHTTWLLNNTEVGTGTFRLRGKPSNFEIYTSIFTARDFQQLTFSEKHQNWSVGIAMYFDSILIVGMVLETIEFFHLSIRQRSTRDCTKNGLI